MSDAASPGDRLSQAIGNRTARVAVLGLGYAGLPLAEVMVKAGYRVLGLDVDADRVARLRRGESYLGHVPAGRVAALKESGKFEATTDCERLEQADVLIVCVPTPLTEHREPDLSFVIAAIQSIAARLRSGRLIVLESTTYPGTTRQVVLPLLEATGLTCGREFFLAFSPEREDPGNRLFTTATIPRVVGGIDEASTRLACQLYGAAVAEVVPVGSSEVAEAAKILENTFRAVNIALVNELKILYDRMGIDIWEVIEAAKTKPFGFQAFYPGPGLGGHCIPIDPFYLAWVARKYDCPARFIRLAGEINAAMPAYVADRVADALNHHSRPVRGSKVCVLGVAYKKDIDDTRESPGIELLHLLRARGALVSYNDPYVPTLTPAQFGLDLTSQPLTDDFLAEQDCLLIAADHSCYEWEHIVSRVALVVDTRNATRHVVHQRDRIFRG